MSGAVLEPRALNELLPNWSESTEVSVIVSLSLYFIALRFLVRKWYKMKFSF